MEGIYETCGTKVICLPTESNRNSEQKIGNKNAGSNRKLGMCSLGSVESLVVSEQNNGMMNAE